MAAQKGHFEIVKFLVEKGAVVDQPANDGGRALHQASFKGHHEVVGFLLSTGANINHVCIKGMSPLYSAAAGGHLRVVKLLVKKGAEIHQKSRLVSSIAALEGQNEVVGFLMSKGAKLEATWAAIATACKCCGATGVPLKRCTGCHCSPKCQKKDWKEGGENRHKIQCARLVEMRARYMEKAKREIEEQMARFGVEYHRAMGVQSQVVPLVDEG